MRLALFDIDGTLLLSGGAGMRAFNRAFGEVVGIVPDHDTVRPDGKTDPLIVRELLAHFGQEELWGERLRDAVFSRYLGNLESEMRRARIEGTLRVLDGVFDLLNALRITDGVALGLVTGNLEAGARIKLENAGLWDYFRFGGYGSDSEDRTLLIRTAIERGKRLVAPDEVETVFVIGDTPLDILHGRAAGAKVVGVASARYSLGELESFSPDLLVTDLRPTPGLLGFLAGS